MLEDVIEKILKKTKTYEERFNKESRSINCQFFTPSDIAYYMCGMFNQEYTKSVRILDPCGGTGILDAYVLKRFVESNKVDEIILDIYEIDEKIIPTLQKNINLLEKEINGICNIKVNIINDNFILKNEIKWKEHLPGEYNYIIGNPPYKKIGKCDAEARAMKEIVYGQPNLYMLFIAMSISLLKEGGELVFLIPRSFCNGKYFKEFRKWLKENCYISNIHSFKDRNKIINDEVLQELVILKLEKNTREVVVLGYSKSNLDINQSSVEVIDTSIIWENSKMHRIRMPLSNGDDELLQKFDELPTTFEKVGIRFSTGQVVDFRVKEGLSDAQIEGAVPLIWSAHFGNNTIKWPVQKKELQQYIGTKENFKILVLAADFILIKRFSSKEENSIKINLLRKCDIRSDYIGIENHVNYATFDENHTMLLMATYILLKSRIYNRYFKMINGTTQINISDLNALPCFELDVLMEIGNNVKKIKIEELTVDVCDKILGNYFY